MKFLLLLLSFSLFGADNLLPISAPKKIAMLNPENGKLILEDGHSWEELSYALLDGLKFCEAKLNPPKPQPPAKKVEPKKK